MRKIKALAIFNTISYLIHLAVVFLTQTRQLNNQDVGQVSAKYETLFSPAGMTFGIWGIIYTLLAILCLYHIIIAYKHDKNHPANTELEKMGGLFIVVNLASAAWILAWTRELIAASVVLIFIQLLALIIIHVRLRMYDPLKIVGLKLANQFPVCVYLGWISIATIANMSAWLYSEQWAELGLDAIQWTVIMIGAAVLLSIFMILGRRDIYFGLVVAWGLYGIIVQRELAGADLYEPVIMAAWAGIGIIGLFSLLQLIRNITYKKPRAIFPSNPLPVK